MDYTAQSSEIINAISGRLKYEGQEYSTVLLISKYREGVDLKEGEAKAFKEALEKARDDGKIDQAHLDALDRDRAAAIEQKNPAKKVAPEPVPPEPKGEFEEKIKGWKQQMDEAGDNFAKKISEMPPYPDFSAAKAVAGFATAKPQTSLTDKLRKTMEENPTINLKKVINDKYAEIKDSNLMKGYGTHADLVIGALRNEKRMVAQHIAQPFQAPLDHITTQGLHPINNPELYTGLNKLETAVKESGIDGAIKTAVDELDLNNLGKLSGSNSKLQQQIINGVAKKIVVPAINDSAETQAATIELMAGLIAQFGDNALKAGVEPAVVSDLIRKASENAAKAIEEGRVAELPSVSDSVDKVMKKAVKHAVVSRF